MTKSSFTESFLLFFIRGCFFFSIFLRVFPNVLSQFPQKQWVQTAQSKNWFNSMRCMHTLQSSYSKRYCPVFIGRCFLSYHKPLCVTNIPSQFPQRQSFQTEWLSVSFNTLKLMYTSESSFLEPFFLGFISRYFNFRHSLQYATKYLFFTFIEIVFKHCLVRKEVCPQCPFANLSMMQFQNCVI